MAGHSKFKNIMHRKGAQDKKRAKVFTKLAREITVAAKAGMPDPEKNPRLRSAIQAARSLNMPNKNIDSAIKKADPTSGEADYVEMRYEGYGPGGTAVIVETLTDNKNRTASEVRAAFSKHNGSLGETGSVGFNFERIGLVKFNVDVASADDMFEAALEAGAEDVLTEDDGHEITCAPDDLNAVSVALEENYGEPVSSNLDWKVLNTTELDENKARTLLKLIDVLEDNDDVQKVASNFEISDEIMEKLSAE
ncbi:MAG: YebC/PmpR family DNA-binding transcriptional regulator [Alphaproteobacteria bacterium]|nr:YebC/PmpR family DNA-binding transcriptional regulator [Alphaproteobacteria bacterium]